MSGNRRAISLISCILLSVSLFLTSVVKGQDSQLVSAQSATSQNAMNADSEAYQIKVQVRRVVLDVIVSDAKGNSVEGLEQGDFKVMEDGIDQPLRFFDVHTGAATGPSQQALDLHLPPDTFSNLTLAPSDKPVTVLLYDMLDTPQESFASAHQALAKFIKDQGNSTKIAIFVLTDRLHMLQGFTDDETRLMQAVNSKATTTQAPPLRTAPFGADADKLLLAAEIDEALNLGIKRSRITVEAFTEIARFVSALPGRKNLIWMSGSFPSEIFNHGRGDPDRLSPEVRRAKDLLDESRVAVYPVDVRGLQVDPQFSAATPGTASLDLSSFGILQRLEHATMNVIADSTGGRAFYNTNGLREAMDAVVREGSKYYTLTYSPTNTKADGRERNIKVTLKYPGYQLSYRRSYFAEDAIHQNSPIPLALDMSMQHGAPNSSGLFFEAKVNPLGDATTPSIEEAVSIQKSQTNARGPRTKTTNGANFDQSKSLRLLRRDAMKIQHYEIDLSMIGRQLEMPLTQNGEYVSNMRFGLAAYSGEGGVLNGSELSIKRPISEAHYQKIRSEGYHVSLLFVVPEGSVSLRMAVRDEFGQRLGTLEIPLPLPPVKQSAGSAGVSR